MTTKDIAQATGKPVRTIQDWVKSISAKSASINAKSALSSPAKPADYDLAEVCQIIEEGMGPEAANVYRSNAVYAEMKEQAVIEDWRRIRELRLSVKDKSLEPWQYQIMIGAPTMENALAPEPKQLEAPLPRLTKQGFAAEMKAQKAEAVKRETNRKSRDLF
jgi:hypothetical protein